jgi:large subunit ribosomal protein L13e
MVRNNHQVPNNHFHKHWAERVRVYLDQAARKRRRNRARKLKALRLFPRPANGLLRPIVRCPTIKYNRRQRLGRGFSLEELKAAGIPKCEARTIGIAVDYRRRNRDEKAFQINVQRLKIYKSKLVLFPRRVKKSKAAKSKETKPKETKPGEVKPGEVKPEEVKPGEVKPETRKSEAPKPEARKSKAPKSEIPKPHEVKKPFQRRIPLPAKRGVRKEKARLPTEAEKKRSAYATLRRAWKKARRVGYKFRKQEDTDKQAKPKESKPEAMEE